MTTAPKRSTVSSAVTRRGAPDARMIPVFDQQFASSIPAGVNETGVRIACPHDGPLLQARARVAVFAGVHARVRVDEVKRRVF